MSIPIFFFSYARADRDGGGSHLLNAQDDGCENVVDTFYNNLCRHVASLTGRPPDQVGFFDRDNLDLGAPWPERIMNGLRIAPVMVALFSPTYFCRPACGREFEIFRRRHLELADKMSRVPDYRVLPVLWVRPDATRQSIPIHCRDYISRIQLTAPDMPDSYHRLGLMRMLELNRKTETNQICHIVADRIFELSRVDKDETLPHLEALDFNKIESAFHRAKNAPQTRPFDPNRREMRVYYLAPTRREWFEASQEDCDSLCDPPEKGRPFNDSPGASVANATEEGIWEGRPNIPIIPDQIPNNLADVLNTTNNSLTTTLIVFDRRSVKIANLKSAIESYSDHNFQNVGLITVAGKEVSKSDIETVCGNKIGALPKLHNWDIPANRRRYVCSVASIVIELEAQLLRIQVQNIPGTGEQIPGLNSSGSVK